MIPNQFRERLLRGDRLIGTVVTLPSPEVAEILSLLRFDWLWIDTEHGAFGALEAQRLLQAAGERSAAVVRVPWADDVWIKKALDIGAAGIIVPQVNTAALARQIVAACKYPPEGTRGVAAARAHKYGLEFQGYVAAANLQTAVILQAEHIEAVDNIDEIVRVEGLDAVLVGPYDLSASMGKIGQLKDREVRQAIEKIRRSCQAAGIRLGIYGDTAQALKPWMDKGFSLIGVGTDCMHLINGAKKVISALSA